MRFAKAVIDTFYTDEHGVIHPHRCIFREVGVSSGFKKDNYGKNTGVPTLHLWGKDEGQDSQFVVSNPRFEIGHGCLRVQGQITIWPIINKKLTKLIVEVDMLLDQTGQNSVEK